MKSNVCKIEKGTKDLAAILDESERFAAYIGLNHKQTLQLRLLCEETDGMLPSIVDDFDGEMWFEYENGVCTLSVSIKLSEMTAEKKEELIKVSKNKKNAAAVGIVGKIRSAVEDLFLDSESMEAIAASTDHARMASGFSGGMDFSYYWSLDRYRSSVSPTEKAEEWDELEKSVIASASDDVIVGVKGSCVSIVIVKKFA